MPKTTVRTRMAPSPTGEYHVGHIATLLKNYAFARRHGGQFILRIEDTDQTRKVEGAVEKILAVINSYGLSWDEGPDIGGPFAPYTQSERLPIYKQMAEQLVASKNAYYCTCTAERLTEIRAAQSARKEPPKYDRHCLHRQTAVEQEIANGSPYVIRLLNPSNEIITFTDLIRGDISINSDILDDQVLLKSDGFPTYHLAVVVDDNAMQISHILRGEEWISSTPKHVLLYRAFGWKQPVYAHIPVFLNPDGKGKMSKRKGTVSAQSFLDAGYLPEALLNFFMILGWSPKDQREILTLDEYIAEFDPADISAKSVVFDIKKLQWINGVYIRNLSLDELKIRCKPFLPSYFDPKLLPKIMPLISERLITLADVGPLSEYFFIKPEQNKELLLKKADSTLVVEQLNASITLLEKTDWETVTLENAIRTLQSERNWKASQYFMLLRVAVSGRPATPPLFDTMTILTKAEVISRLQDAIAAVQVT